MGKGRILTCEQEKETQRLIRDGTPDPLKIPYAWWHGQAMCELAERRYNRKLAIRDVGLYLERLGFTPRKMLRKAYEQRPDVVHKGFQRISLRSMHAPRRRVP